MKILIITPSIPYPLDEGGKQAQFHILNSLRSKIEFTIVSPVDNIKNKISYINELQSKWDNVLLKPFVSHNRDVEVIIIKIIKRIKRLIKKILGKDIKRDVSALYSNDYDLHGNMLSYIQDLLSKNDYDIIQIEFYQLLPLIFSLKTSAKKIFVHHELRYVRNEIEKKLFKRKYIYDDYIFNLKKSFEIKMLNEYDAVVTLTDVDKGKLETEGVNKPIFCSPAGITFPEITIGQLSFNKQIIFLGGERHYPNVDALTWFLDEIWSDVYRQDKALQFKIIGFWSENFRKKYSNNENVSFLGFVPDLQDVLINSIMVIPIRIGSGMRMKILETVNYYCPFVTTSVGVEGLCFENQKDCVIANDKDDFVKGILSLSNNPSLFESLAINSKNTFDLNYSIETLSEKRYNYYQAITKNELRND